MSLHDDLKPYPAMKDSGVPWLGEVPEHWEVLTFRRIGKFFKGNGGTKDDELEEGIPCIRYGDLYTQYKFFIRTCRSFVSTERASDYTALRYGDVLFAGSGETIEEIGKSAVNLLDSEACCGGDILLWRPAREVVPPFFGYASDSPQSVYQKACMGRGVTVMHIYSNRLKNLWLALPPLPEQSVIVRFLDHMDRRIKRAIRAKQKLIALLTEQKQATIHQAVTRGLDPNVRLKPSGVEWLGEVPEEWEVLRLGRLIQLTTGFPFKSEDFSQHDDDVRLLRGINIAPGRVRWDAVVRWRADQCGSFAEFQLREGDVVLGMDRPTISGGVRVAKIGPTDVPSLVLQRVARIRPHAVLDRDFLLFILGGKSFSDYLAPIFTGISVPHVSPEQIGSFRIALPQLAVQLQIVNWLNDSMPILEAATNSANSEISLLREYRTRLIADVVTGKLDVRAEAAQLPEEVEAPEALDQDDALMKEDESGEECADLGAVPKEALA